MRRIVVLTLTTLSLLILLAAGLFFLLSPTASAAPPIFIVVPVPRANAEEVVDNVARPVEAALAGFQGIQRISSVSSRDRCTVRIDLDKGFDLKDSDHYSDLRRSVAKKLDQLRSALPKAVDIVLSSSVKDSVALIVLRSRGDKDGLFLSKYARETLRRQLVRIQHVAGVSIAGETVTRPQIKMDPINLAARDLTPLDLMAKLRGAAKSNPAAERMSLEDLRELVITTRAGRPVFLQDVATVAKAVDQIGHAGLAWRKDRAIVEAPAVLLLIHALPHDAGELLTGLDEAWPRLQRDLPAGVVLEKHASQPTDVTAILRGSEGMGLERKSALARSTAKGALGAEAIQRVAWFAKAQDEEIILRATVAANTQDGRANLRTELAKIKDASARVVGHYPFLKPWPGEGMDIVARVCGDNLKDLRETANRLGERLAKVEGVVDLHQDARPRPELVINVHRDRAGQLGVKMMEVAEVLELALGGNEVPRLRVDNEYVIVTLPDGPGRMTKDRLAALTVRGGDGKLVPLSTVVTARMAEAPPSIYREAGRFVVVVSCNVQGRDLAAVRADVGQAAKELAEKGAVIEVAAQAIETHQEPGGPTTVIVIRHAEKDVGDDPSLTEKGHKRAKELVHVLGQAGIKAIYAAKLKRTQQTAQPLLARLKLATLLDTPLSAEALAKEVRTQYAGQTVLIVGQAPTIPGMLLAFGVGAEEGRITSISYDNMFIIQVPAKGKAKLLKLKYGESSP